MVARPGEAEPSLTHDFHHTVTEEGAAALKSAKTLQIQRPDVLGWVAMYHPLCQVPDGSSEEKPRHSSVEQKFQS